MPQFDFATFLPQIFWLLISFAIFYYCASRIIIPRISLILNRREERVSKDKISAHELQAQINEVNKLSFEIREKSAIVYKKSIEDTAKKCAEDREKSLNKTKEDLEKMTKDSEDRIADFINNSKTDYNSAALLIANAIVKKIIGQDANFKEEIKVSINKFDN